MGILKRAWGRVAQGVIDFVMGGGLSQKENRAQGPAVYEEADQILLRQAAAESIVLLKNEGNTLPLTRQDTLAVFGRVQNDWFYVGYGSGGDVHPPCKVSLMDALKENGVSVEETLAKTYDTWCKQNPPDHGWWGHWPFCYEEMPLTGVDLASLDATKALVVLGRAAGEERENRLEPGSYYLTEGEKDLLDTVCKRFSQVILVFNCGNIIDLSFLKEYPVSAVLYAWQGGQQSGSGLCDVLTGAVTPCGKLPDTIARNYADYPSAAHFGNKAYNEYYEDIFVGYRYFSAFAPEKVLYPFGFGLSYTTFSRKLLAFTRNAHGAEVLVQVENTGSFSGKEVVQLYLQPPEGELPKAKRVLVAFQKTKCLAPGEQQVLSLSFTDLDCASYHPKEHAFLLEPGQYTLYLGDSASENTVTSFYVSHTQVVCRCNPVCPPREAFETITGPAYTHGYNRKGAMLQKMPREIPFTGDLGIKLQQVAQGESSLDAFIAQLTDKELSDLTHGEGGMGSSLGTPGNAGAFGGITKQLRDKGVPAIITADGPAGLRIRRYTTLLPCGTALASTWDADLCSAVYGLKGKQAREFNVDVVLSPGMNIHRNVLCGRNFEYYSEDPLLTGKIAAAAVRGIQSQGVSACPKHFACNNQEYNRNYNDSRLSQRALREIYLRGFEICVKEAKPQNLMTSYNLVNGIYAHYHYDLVTTVLREEWGYEGNVVTDWWTRPDNCEEFPLIRNDAFRIRAQVDVLMPGNPGHLRKSYRFDRAQLKTLGKPGGLTRGELQRTAKNVLRFALTRLPVKEGKESVCT